MRMQIMSQEKRMRSKKKGLDINSQQLLDGTESGLMWKTVGSVDISFQTVLRAFQPWFETKMLLKETCATQRAIAFLH